MTVTNDEQSRGRFHWDQPAKYNFSRDVIDRWAIERPDQLALIWVNDQGVEEKRTFREISAASKKVCNVLAGMGIQRGDIVVVALQREIAWWEIVTACLRMGAIVAPGTTQLKAKDIEYRLERAEASCFVTTIALAEELEEASQCSTLKGRIVVGGSREGWISYDKAVTEASEQFETVDTAADESALCYFTSGTTGNPKMVLHTHTSYPLAHQTTGTFWLDQHPDDLHWNLSDTGWAKAAWSSYFGPWYCGSTVFIHHSSGFRPANVLDLLEKYPISTFCAPPTAYRMLVQEDLTQREFPGLRHCTSAGEPLNPEIIEKWYQATGVVIHDGYGQTETVLLCGNFPGMEPRYGSMGKPAPGMDLHVVDDQGNILPSMKEGEIALRVKPERPLGLFREYWKDPDLTASVHRGDWYLTGDRGYIDEDGYFWFVGRADDVIISAGYRIGPFEVESALLEHPAVAEAAAVASPDEVRGAVVKAFIVLSSGYSPNEALKIELQEHVRQVTAPYKYPRKIEFVPDLPKTTSGKIRRLELRNMST